MAWVKDVVEVIANIFQILAIIAGGVWVFFNFFKGRTYQPRLELDVSGSVFSHGLVKYLLTTIRLKNVGLSKVEIRQRGSGLRVFGHNPAQQAQATRSASWRRLATFRVFEEHHWVEPGETIVDQRLVKLPPDGQVALKLVPRIVSGRSVWKSTKIVSALGESKGSNHGPEEEAAKV